MAETPRTTHELKPELKPEAAPAAATYPGRLSQAASEPMREAVKRALERIEGETAARWMNEQFNDGARAAAAVLREELHARNITL
jgi:hypothetical protein